MNPSFTWLRAAPSACRPGSAHVWRFRLDDATAAAVAMVISPEERSRASQFVSGPDGHRFVAARGMLRRLLGQYVGTPAAALEFGREAFGKPYLVGAPGSTHVRFNLSHSGDLALLAVSPDCAVGVDVQQVTPHAADPRLAARVYSPVERSAVEAMNLAPALAGPVLAAVWSRKEAYLKGTGRGLANGLQVVDVTVGMDDAPRLLADRADPGAHTRWSMASIPAGDGYSATLAIEAAPVARYELFDAGPDVVT